MTARTPDDPAGFPEAENHADANADNSANNSSTNSAAINATAAAAAARQAVPKPPGVMDALQSIWRELPGLVSDRIDLLSLELQRAGKALAQIVALLVAAAILGVTAWLALCAGLAVGLVELGLHWALSLLLMLVLNAGLAVFAIDRLRGLLPLLRLPATRRHLTPGHSTVPDVPTESTAPPSAGASPGAAVGQTG